MMQQEQRAVGRFVGLLLVLFGFSVWGQTQSLTVTSYSDAVRFAAQGSVKELRVEILSLAGQKIFDSGPVSSGILDWKLLNREGQLVASGVYLYTVTVKDEFGNVTKRLGKLALVRGKPGQVAPPLTLPTVSTFAHTQPQHVGSWDVDHGTEAYTLNTSAMGIGTQNPSAMLDVAGRGHFGALGSVGVLILRMQAQNNWSDGVRVLKRGNTASIDGPLLNGAELGYNSFFGWDGSTYGRGAYFIARAAENWSTAGRGTDFGIATTAIGSTTNSIRLWVTAAGNVGIGTMSPTERLTVAGVVQSTSGGFRFPDGSLQTTAAGTSFWAASGNHIYNTNPGNVGIGVAGTETHKLHVATNNATEGAAAILGHATATTVSTFGVMGRSESPDGIGVHGEASASSGHGVRGLATASTGVTRGVFGMSYSPDGHGVFGHAFATSGSATGVTGVSDSIAGYGVFGNAMAASGTTRGVMGQSASTSGMGVNGHASASSGVTYGVVGTSASTQGRGVVGYATATSGETFGVTGVVNSPSGAGIRALSGVDPIANPSSLLIVALSWTSVPDTEFKVQQDGNVYADGSFIGGGADYADMLQVAGKKTDYEPGDVLIIGPDGKLTKAIKPYSTAVAGVYSTQPAFVGDPLGAREHGEAEPEDRVPVALVGVVPVKVTAENGAISPGDLLTTSATLGHAMKAKPAVINGVEIYPTGAILGKALESLEKGTGVIKVLVTLR